MAKYDWAKLKREYMLGNYKSLREFAENEGIPFNGYFRKMTTGWTEEKRQKQDKKETKIIEGVRAREIQQAVDRNTRHLQTGDAIMEKLNTAILVLEPEGKNALYLLQAAAATLEKIQKTQMIGDDRQTWESCQHILHLRRCWIARKKNSNRSQRARVYRNVIQTRQDNRTC